MSAILSKVVEMTSRRTHSIAIVGGGITGSCAAAELANHFEHVEVYDQGRRGPGGRASHRSVNPDDCAVLPDDELRNDEKTFEFDHGCQFFRADSKEFQKQLLESWCSNGWAAPWKARLGSLPEKKQGLHDVDFFGIPSLPDNVYIGYGGMHQLPRKILESSNAVVHRGTRVSSVRKNAEGRWDIFGVTGTPAFHDTDEKEATKFSEEVIGSADAVLFTDISSSSDSWHRASAGIPDSLRARIPEKIRVALFSCMIALKNPIGDKIPFDGFSTDNHKLWFASRSQSKPGFPECEAECWTLISTPSFAVEQIRDTTMRDPITGKFRPQENNYLNSIPGPALFDAFVDVVKPYLQENEHPEAIYLQAQRWGSGLPAPASIALEIEEICGTRYAGNLRSSMVFPRPNDQINNDFIADDDLKLYYAGDFCSYRNPGFESAAMSGLDAARHIATMLK